MAQAVVNLKDERHLVSGLLKNLWSSKDRRPHNQTDLVFKCSDGEIPAHRIIIQFVSKTIGPLLQQCSDDDPVVVVVVPSHNYRSVQKFLQMIYAGESELQSGSDLESIIEFGRRQLGMPIFLHKNVTIEEKTITELEVVDESDADVEVVAQSDDDRSDPEDEVEVLSDDTEIPKNSADLDSASSAFLTPPDSSKTEESDSEVTEIPLAASPMKKRAEVTQSKSRSHSEVIEIGENVGDDDEDQQLRFEENRRQTRSCTRKKSATVAHQTKSDKSFIKNGDINGNSRSSKADEIKVQFEKEEKQLRRGRKRKSRSRVATDNSCKRSRSEGQQAEKAEDNLSRQASSNEPQSFGEPMTTIYVENFETTIRVLEEEENIKFKLLEKCLA